MCVCYFSTGQTEAADSLFTYVAPQTHTNVQDATFEPVHYSDSMLAPDSCSGNPFCVYDYNVTESMDYALGTSTFFDELQMLVNDLNSGKFTLV